MPFRQRRRMARSARARPVKSYAPPQLKSNIVVKHNYRFTATAGANVAINAQNLILAAGTVCTVVNSVATSFFGSVKVQYVNVWSPPSAQGNFATCSIEYNGAAAASTVEFSDTSVSPTQPAMLKTRPPKSSNASFWQTPNVGNNAMFTLICPANSIIDVGLDLLLYDDEASAPVTRAIAAGVVGLTYYLALDSLTGHNLVPVSLTTTS